MEKFPDFFVVNMAHWRVLIDSLVLPWDQVSVYYPTNKGGYVTDIKPGTNLQPRKVPGNEATI